MRPRHPPPRADPPARGTHAAGTSPAGSTRTGRRSTSCGSTSTSASSTRTSYDLIVSLGSEFAAFDDHKPFVPREARLMEKAVQDDVPVLGLCFGGQMLARVLGGEVSRGDVAEIGWLPVHTTDPELVPEDRGSSGTSTTFTTPPGATLIAESDVGPQAFVAGRSLGSSSTRRSPPRSCTTGSGRTATSSTTRAWTRTRCWRRPTGSRRRTGDRAAAARTLPRPGRARLGPAAIER